MNSIIDKNTQKLLSQVCPDLATRWKAAATELWNSRQLRIRVTAGLRSSTAQWDLYRQGRAKSPAGWIIVDPSQIVTHAMPGQSFHNFGLALDSCFFGEDPFLKKLGEKEAQEHWGAFGKAIKATGLTWGGDWKGPKNDRPHCEASYGLSLKTLKALRDSQGLEAVYEQCLKMNHCGRELV